EGDGCWPDLAQSAFVTGELQPIARLPAGTNRGNSSVGLRVMLPDGRIAIAETTMLLFLTAGEAFAMRESMALAEALDQAEVKAWKKVRNAALRGFVKCADGRLYHSVVSKVALTSWFAKLQQRYTTECGRLKKQAQRHRTEYSQEPFTLWITRCFPDTLPFVSKGQPDAVPEDDPRMSSGQSPSVPGNPAPIEVKGSSSYQSPTKVEASHQPPGQRAREANPSARSRNGAWRYDPGACSRMMAE